MMRRLHIIDSVIYMDGVLASDADFLNIHVPPAKYSDSRSFIARYVDTSLMHPFVYNGGGQGEDMSAQDAATGKNEMNVYPNPTAGRLYVDLPGEEVTKVFVISTEGRRWEVRPEKGSISLKGYPAGVYFLQVFTRENLYQKKVVVR